MMQALKILYLITQSEWGGAQRYIFDLATTLSAQNYQVEVAAGGNQDLFSQLSQKGIKTYQLKNLVREINPAKDLMAYFEIKKLIKQTLPDILHLNSSKAGVVGAIAGKRLGVKKIIYTAHGFVFNEPMPTWKKLLYLWAEKYSAHYKDTLICVSEFDRQVGIKNKIASEKKLIKINNGIEKIYFLDQKQARAKLNLPANKTIIGTIAHFYPTKGLIYLIRAAKIVANKFPDIIFAVIGDGQQRNLLQTEIKKLDLTNNFFLLGNKFLKDKKEASRYLPAFALSVLPSVKEGFPFVILEAMQAGLPIVATCVGGIPEMIKDNESGLLVPPANPENLAQAIIKLLENKNLADQLGRQAKIDVAQKFSLEKMITRTKEVYRL